MCGADAFLVGFAPNQRLPEPYVVEGYDGTFYAAYGQGQWIGEIRRCRFQARRDALDHKSMMDARKAIAQ